MPFPLDKISNWQSHLVVDGYCLHCHRAFFGYPDSLVYTKEDATMKTLPGGNVTPCR